MGNLVLTGATSGSATVQATDAATVTITLPATSGTLALTSGGGSPTFTTITTTNDATISGLTVGKGGGASIYNTAVGSGAANANTTGVTITAVGYRALYANTSGNNNVAFGESALLANTTGSSNTAVGVIPLGSNTSGGNNVAVGQEALRSNTTASNNTAVGYQAGYTNTVGQYNVFVGWKAGYAHTGTAGGNNTFVGQQAGTAVTTGYGNSFYGVASGSAITTGYSNTILGGYTGNQGGLDIRTSSNNIVLSDGDGNPRIYNNGTWTNIASLASTDATGIRVVNGDGVFYFAKDNSAGAAFGWGAYQNVIFSGNKNIYVQAQTGGVYLANGGTSWTSASDERLKENLVPITDATNKVSTLRAVTGNLIADENKKSRSFLIAQDVQKVLPEAVNVQDDEMQTLGVSYTDVIPLLVAAIQELNAKVTALEAQLGAK